MEGPGRPRAQWQRCRSSTAMPGDQRWRVDRSRTSDWNRTRYRASAERVQAGTLTFEGSGRPDPSWRKQPGEQRRRSVRPVRRPVSNAAPKRALDSVRPAAPATEVAASADQRSPPVTDPPCQSVRKPPAPPQPDRSQAAFRAPCPGSTELNLRFRPRTSASTSPRTGSSKPPGLPRGTTEAITTRQPHSLASEQEQRVRLSTTNSDCE